MNTIKAIKTINANIDMLLWFKWLELAYMVFNSLRGEVVKSYKR